MIRIKSITETIDSARLDLDSQETYASKSNFIISKLKTTTYEFIEGRAIWNLCFF